MEDRVTEEMLSQFADEVNTKRSSNNLNIDAIIDAVNKAPVYAKPPKPQSQTPTQRAIDLIERKVQEDGELPDSFRSDAITEKGSRSRSYQTTLDTTLRRYNHMSDLVRGLA